LTLKIDVGSMNSVLASVIAPAAPAPAAASRKRIRLPATTRTPTEAAASSSSRIACSDEPSRLRSSTNSATMKKAVKPSVIQ
jgi:hypothetical protein